MNESQREYLLRLFLHYAENEKQPPAELMEYVAGGVREFLKGGKPWQIKTGRPGFGAKWNQHSLAVQCYALEAVGISRDRAAILLGLTDLGAKAHRRYIQHGAASVQVANAGKWSHRFALELLLELPELKREERAALTIALESLQAEEPEDEPGL